MAKSTAIPTNNTPNPTDTRLSVPTEAAANSTVSISPSTRVSRIGTISRHDRTARNSHNVISTMLPISPWAAPWATVENSSSAAATWPVIFDTRGAGLHDSRSAITARMAAVAAPPGSK